MAILQCTEEKQTYTLGILHLISSTAHLETFAWW